VTFSRWHRRFQAVMVLVALTLTLGRYVYCDLANFYYGQWIRGVSFGLKRTDGSPFCGALLCSRQVFVGLWRPNGTVVFGAGVDRTSKGWSAGMNTLDADSRLTWRRSVEF
jgi:hypothetical protein